MIKHLMVDGQPITEMTYKLRVNGVEFDACARTLGHLTTIQMIVWIEKQRAR